MAPIFNVVVLAIGERDVAVAEAEAQAGEALRRLVSEEHLAVSEALVWCGNAVSGQLVGCAG